METIKGKIIADPELGHGATSGLAYTKFSVVLNCVVFGPKAEAMALTAKKGDQVEVTGTIKIDEWKDKTTGEDRKAYKMSMDEIKFLDGKILEVQRKADTPESGEEMPF
jgi:single-stranded DNA-binding protein